MTMHPSATDTNEMIRPPFCPFARVASFFLAAALVKEKTSRHRQKGKNMKLEEVNLKTKEAVDLSGAVAEVRAECGPHAVSRSHGEVPQLQLWQHHAHCEAESRDIVLYLAGVNEHTALRIVGNKRWRVSHLLWTVQFFSTMEFTS
jgi:hypothetical protein